MDATDIAALDRASVLHPFTQLKDFATGKLGDPTIVETGAGVRIQDATGRSYIDGFGGLYCVNIGYGRTEVADAIARQAHKLAYYHTYAAHTTDQLAILSDRLVRMAPGKMSKVFYGTSRSDGNETNVKLVWYYNNLRGKHAKKKIIARERGYHGCTVMSGSLTGMSFYHDHMDLPVSGILRTGVPHYYFGAVEGESEEQFSQRRARAGGADPQGGAGQYRRLHRRARPWHRWHHPAAARLLAGGAGGAGEIRHPPDRRRGDLWLRPARNRLRMSHVPDRTRSHHDRQGPDLRLFPPFCGDCQREGL